MTPTLVSGCSPKLREQKIEVQVTPRRHPNVQGGCFERRHPRSCSQRWFFQAQEGSASGLRGSGWTKPAGGLVPGAPLGAVNRKRQVQPRGGATGTPWSVLQPLGSVTGTERGPTDTPRACPQPLCKAWREQGPGQRRAQGGGAMGCRDVPSHCSSPFPTFPGHPTKKFSGPEGSQADPGGSCSWRSIDTRSQLPLLSHVFIAPAPEGTGQSRVWGSSSRGVHTQQQTEFLYQRIPRRREKTLHVAP